MGMPGQLLRCLFATGHGPGLACASEMSSKVSQAPCPQELTDPMEEGVYVKKTLRLRNIDDSRTFFE